MTKRLEWSYGIIKHYIVTYPFLACNPSNATGVQVVAPEA